MIDVVGYSLDEAIDIIYSYKPDAICDITIYTAPACSHDNENINWDKKVIRQKYKKDNIIELTISYFKKSF